MVMTSYHCTKLREKSSIILKVFEYLELKSVGLWKSADFFLKRSFLFSASTHYLYISFPHLREIFKKWRLIVKNNARKFFESFLPHLLHLLQMSTKAPPSLYLSSSPSSNYYPLYPLEPLVLPCCYKVLQSLFCYIKTLLESPVHRHFCCCSM